MKKVRVELSTIVWTMGSMGFGGILTLLFWKGGLTPPESLGALLGLVSLLISGVAFFESKESTQLIRDIQSTLDTQAKPLDQVFRMHTSYLQLQLNLKAEGGEVQLPPSGTTGM